MKGKNIKDSGKKFDTMANVSNLAGNPICVVMDNTYLKEIKYWSVEGLCKCQYAINCGAEFGDMMITSFVVRCHRIEWNVNYVRKIRYDRCLPHKHVHIYQ